MIGDKELVYSGSPLLGGHQVFRCFSKGEEGVCSVVDPNGATTIAVVPDVAVAQSVAFYGVSPDGGYSCLEIHLTPGVPVNVHSLEDFIG